MTVSGVAAERETPYIDPEMRALLDRVIDPNAPDVATLPIADARRRTRDAHLLWNAPPVDGVSARDVSHPLDGRSVRLRIFTPERPRPGAVLYLHGGGWTFCDVETHTRAMALIAVAARAVVVGVDYRLAPEHRFPAALEDVVEVFEAVRDGALDLVRPPVALAGDSAGANLALAASLRVRDGGSDLQPAGAALLYGCYQATTATLSHQIYGDGRFGLSSARMAWFWRNYLGDVQNHPHAEPLRADLQGSPPAFVLSAGLDPLRDDSISLASKLRSAGVATQTAFYPGVSHGFMQYSAALAPAEHALNATGAALRRMLDLRS